MGENPINDLESICKKLKHVYNMYFSKVLRFADVPITNTCSLLVLVARLPKATVIPSFFFLTLFF